MWPLDEVIGYKSRHEIEDFFDFADSLHRGDEKYLELITNEHELIKNELKLISNLNANEEIERDLFNRFSNELRNAHEV